MDEKLKQHEASVIRSGSAQLDDYEGRNSLPGGAIEASPGPTGSAGDGGKSDGSSGEGETRTSPDAADGRDGEEARRRRPADNRACELPPRHLIPNTNAVEKDVACENDPTDELPQGAKIETTLTAAAEVSPTPPANSSWPRSKGPKRHGVETVATDNIPRSASSKNRTIDADAAGSGTQSYKEELPEVVEAVNCMTSNAQVGGDSANAVTENRTPFTESFLSSVFG